MDRTEQHSRRYGSTGAFLGKQTKSTETATKNITLSGSESTTVEFTSKPNKKKSNKK